MSLHKGKGERQFHATTQVADLIGEPVTRVTSTKSHREIVSRLARVRHQLVSG